VCQGEVLGRYEAVLAPDRSIACERFSEEVLHLVCPWHGWEYEVETGECVTDRRLRLRAFPTVVRDGQVFVRLP
jgi:nitrite reductase/ring-hydroxylating ferredoxin subunit